MSEPIVIVKETVAVDSPLLMLARDNLRTTMVLLGLVVIIVSAIIRKHRRLSRRRNSDRQEAANLEASLARHADHATPGGTSSR